MLTLKQINNELNAIDTIGSVIDNTPSQLVDLVDYEYSHYITPEFRIHYDKLLDAIAGMETELLERQTELETDKEGVLKQINELRGVE